jgi:predicted glycoside hydrolase/deacetylase ChbG (UPF0249 family)
MSRRLIVNADDFGLTAGVNRAVAEAHRHGVLTSASLMVDEPGAREAASLARALPGLSVGLHAAAARDADWAGELRRQLARFDDLLGRTPTHLDSHHNVHRETDVLPQFQRVAAELGIPLREHSPARYFSRFYGQWDGETHPEQISVERLVAMLDEEVGEGVTELATHPGYVDAQLRSGYAAEREVELATLVDPRVAEAIRERGIDLVGFDVLGTRR